MKTKDLERLKEYCKAIIDNEHSFYDTRLAFAHDFTTIAQNEIVRKHQKKEHGGFWSNLIKTSSDANFNIIGLQNLIFDQNKQIESKDSRIKTLEKQVELLNKVDSYASHITDLMTVSNMSDRIKELEKQVEILSKESGYNESFLESARNELQIIVEKYKDKFEVDWEIKIKH